MGHSSSGRDIPLRQGLLLQNGFRGHTNILKRLLVHVSGFNLGLLMRSVFGVGTPRSLQGRLEAVLIAFSHVLVAFLDRLATDHGSDRSLDRFLHAEACGYPLPKQAALAA